MYIHIYLFIFESFAFKQVCQHPHIKMREWGAEAVTFLVKAALYYKPANGMKDNKVSFYFFKFN